MGAIGQRIVEKTGEYEYRISLAVVGFAEVDLEIEAREGMLTVTGRQGKEDEKERQFLHRGIAGRALERLFRLADHVQVTGAKLENGLPHIELVRNVPEAMKPRRVLIGDTKVASTGMQGPSAPDQRSSCGLGVRASGVRG